MRPHLRCNAMATLFVEQLANLDFALLDPERGLVGETYLMDLELSGELDAQGMVLDFGRVKREVRAAAEALVDHKLLVPAAHPALHIQPGQVVLGLVGGGEIEVCSPDIAFCRLPAMAVTVETVADAVSAAVRAVVPDNVDAVRVQLQPEAIDGAYYHYCHGLRKHDGDCQRIAHGHRSRLKITRAGERDPALEGQWAERWNNRFLATVDDELAAQRPGHRRFGYDAPQGRFEIELPEGQIDVIPGDTTVECLAAYIAGTLAAQQGQAVTVRAYEGLRKGALASAEPA